MRGQELGVEIRCRCREEVYSSEFQQMFAQRDGYSFGAVGSSEFREYRPDVLLHRVKENAKLEIVEIAGTHPKKSAL